MAEELLAEEQAGIGPGRSTVEQIFSNRIVIEKNLQHQRDLFYSFINFRKAFDRVWHAGLWQVLRSLNIEEGLSRAIQALHENSRCAVLLNSQVGRFFKTTAGVRQECSFSLILLIFFLEKFMQETLNDHHSSIAIGGRSIYNLRFTDDIDLKGGSNDEPQYLTNKFVVRVRAYGMEVSTDKSKIITNSTNNISADISMNSQNLEEVASFKYLGATLCKDGACSAESRIRIASATVGIAGLNRICRSSTISLASKFKLYKSRITPILLYGLETWTLLAD